MTVASDLGRSESGLREKLIREGYTFNKRMINSEPKIKKKKPRWTEDELAYMFEHLRVGIELNDLAEELGRTERTVRTKIERMGYTYRNRILVKK
jgi:predicted transcriptional regulator